MALKCGNGFPTFKTFYLPPLLSWGFKLQFLTFAIETGYIICVALIWFRNPHKFPLELQFNNTHVGRHHLVKLFSKGSMLGEWSQRSTIFPRYRPASQCIPSSKRVKPFKNEKPSKSSMISPVIALSGLLLLPIVRWQLLQLPLVVSWISKIISPWLQRTLVVIMK